MAKQAAESIDARGSIQELVLELQASFAQYVGAHQDPAEHIRHMVARLPGDIRIKVQREQNHARPHFYALAADECDISVDIETTEILAGECRRHWKIIRRWAFNERDRLRAIWNRLHEGQGHDFSLGA
jgi:hypothetical protein